MFLPRPALLLLSPVPVGRSGWLAFFLLLSSLSVYLAVPPYHLRCVWDGTSRPTSVPTLDPTASPLAGPSSSYTFWVFLRTALCCWGSEAPSHFAAASLWPVRQRVCDARLSAAPPLLLLSCGFHFFGLTHSLRHCAVPAHRPGRIPARCCWCDPLLLSALSSLRGVRFSWGLLIRSLAVAGCR